MPRTTINQSHMRSGWVEAHAAIDAPHTARQLREHMLVNVMRGFQKEKNMRRDPRVTLLCYDPHEPLRSLEVRGRVLEMTECGALEHLDALAVLYTRKAPFFGTCVPADLQLTETPLICRILPTHVVALDARKHDC